MHQTFYLSFFLCMPARGAVGPRFPCLAGRRGRRDFTGTLYLLFQTLVRPSLITESKFYIHRYKNKTTTVMVFTVSIHTVLSPIYIYIYKNCTFTFTYSERGTYCGGLLLVWLPGSVRKIADVGLKLVLSFTLSGKHIAYTYTHA